MNTPFLLFAGESYYAAASWDEFRGAFATLNEASRAVHAGEIPRRTDRDWEDKDDPEYSEHPEERIEWYQIVDVRTLEVVEHGGLAYGGIERPNSRPFARLTLEWKQP